MTTLTDLQKDLWRKARDLTVTAVPLAYGTSNLGDDIQTKAALRFFETEQTVPRDHASRWNNYRVALCGWFGHISFRDLPEEIIVIGLHLHHEFAKTINAKGWERLRAAVKQQGFPAGCRDTDTMDLLRAQGIEAEFSGCVTQTLATYEGKRSGKFAVDAPVPNSSWKPMTHRHIALATLDATGRLAMATGVLDCYRTAEKIVTSRLHAYLPAEAMGVPVVKFVQNGPLVNPSRWSGHLVAKA